MTNDKTNMTRIFYILLLAVSVLPAQAFADTWCQCPETKPNPRYAKEAALSVFSGKVTRIHYLEEKEKVSFEVEKVWKGLPEGTKETHVYTERTDLLKMVEMGLTCGYPFQRGESYLVYTYHYKASPPHVDKCSRTKPLSEAGEDLKELRVEN